jgi:pilus assembly protein Flp/PilA
MNASFKGHPMKTRTLARMAQLCHDETGQDLIEYALIAALIGLGAVASMKSLGSKVGTAFNNIGSTLSTNT